MFVFSLLLHLALAQSLIGGLSEIAGFFTGRDPERTMVNQVGHAGAETVLDAAGALRENVQKRASVNSRIFLKNLETIGGGASALKNVAAQTYVGAGILGAGQTLKDVVFRQVPGMLRGSGLGSGLGLGSGTLLQALPILGAVAGEGMPQTG
ncbi:hypothetical protein GNI_005210 [Gregarina niphandrodes]|uniref:Uncharacterized protein n=1 Tax=Gregarina niphandrodes TaxID=110365 RepID=A0A023BDA2_GRENI|nr:hypothetical protein GNI_005210 [Gregarina niphandrodes]EZG88173.1 hypothetical protein GNI_005210 [Gregarina niphandrodes]|eukprot:XP_011128597.1 hypothetical protein GNI_005210 [Gregarina niphandrodes]